MRALKRRIVLNSIVAGMIAVMPGAASSLASGNSASARAEAIAALRQAVAFYRTHVSVHGA